MAMVLRSLGTCLVNGDSYQVEVSRGDVKAAKWL